MHQYEPAQGSGWGLGDGNFRIEIPPTMVHTIPFSLQIHSFSSLHTPKAFNSTFSTLNPGTHHKPYIIVQGSFQSTFKNPLPYSL